jgi:hypothetical protein
MRSGIALTHVVREARRAQQSLCYCPLDANPGTRHAEGAKPQSQRFAGFSGTAVCACPLFVRHIRKKNHVASFGSVLQNREVSEWKRDVFVYFEVRLI